MSDEKKNFLVKVKEAPHSLRAWLRIKFNFNQHGKTILSLGRDSMTTRQNEPVKLIKMGSGFWTRLKNLVLLPWRYLKHGKIEL